MACKCLSFLFGKKRKVTRPITLSPAGGRKPVVLTPVGGTPNAFSFTSQTDVGLNSSRTSNQITVGGLTVPVVVTVSGDSTSSYIKNGAPKEFLPGTAFNGDTFRVNHFSSASNSTAVSTTLTIGGVSATFTSTTLAAAVGTALSAPTLTRTSSNTSGPFTADVYRPGDWHDGSNAVARWTSDFVTYTEGTPITLAATTTSASYGFASAGNTGPKYFQVAAWDGTRPGALNWSIPVGFGDTVAPTITSSASRTSYQNIAATLPLTANKGVTWAVVGGFNQGIYGISGQNLLQEAWPTVQALDVQVQATSYCGVPSTVQTIAVNNQVNTAAAFDLGANTTGASRSTTYNSPNSVTVSGLAPGSTVAWNLTSGFEAQVGGTGAWLTSGTIGNGAVLGPVRFATGSVYSAVASTTLTIGSTTDTWSVTVMDDPASVAFQFPATQPAVLSTGGATRDFVGSFTPGGHAVVYMEPTFGRSITSVTLIGAGASGADISLVSRINAVSGSWRQEVWTCPDGSTVVSGTNITIRMVFSAGMGNVGILIGTLINATNTVLEASAVLDFPTGADPASTAAIIVPTLGVGVCFGYLNATTPTATATTGTKVATGIDYGGGDVRGIISRQTTTGSWTPTFDPPGATAGCGLVALAWGP